MFLNGRYPCPGGIYLLILLSGCFRSYDGRPVTDADAGTDVADSSDDIDVSSNYPVDSGDGLEDSHSHWVDSSSDLDNIKNDKSLLIGTWEGYANGSTAFPTKFTFSETELTVTISPLASFTGSYSIDSNAVPHQLSLSIENSTGVEMAGLIARAIYKIEYGLLTIATTFPGSPRPLSFDSLQEEVIVFELTRNEL